jgi:cyclopropane fatty-acyl-phospholipid synthase-like methyltransferase
VANPWLDYAHIYNDDYYAGRGADPLVNYVYEMASFPNSLRLHEWRGIRERVASLTDLGPHSRWLDYGCGAGGLVRYLIESGYSRVVGFEQEWALPRLQALNVPVMTEAELEQSEHVFDIVTAVEVMEHVLDPVAELRRLRRVLRPGGLLFVTTGNPRPYLDRLDQWKYVVPEVHISFFTPETMAWAMEHAGFRTEFPGYGPGWTNILRFKILKNLGRRQVSPADSAVPWPVVARMADRRFAVSAQPVGWAV